MSDSRLTSGHAALDEVLGGGLPAQGISLIMGLPGTGKTIIAQQYAFHNADPERPVVLLHRLRAAGEDCPFRADPRLLRCLRGRQVSVL